MYFRLLVLAVALLLAGQAYGLEIYRNGKAYDIAIDLPFGETFANDSIDRKFNIKGVEGNLRLIQDEYSSCTSLVSERQSNKLDEGFSEVLSAKNGSRDCAVKLRNPQTGVTVSSFYIYLNSCKCFAALQLAHDDATESMRNRVVQNLLDQLRANNRPLGNWVADKGQDEWLTCDQKRQRGMKAEENEIDFCNLNGTDPADKKKLARYNDLKRKLQERLTGPTEEERAALERAENEAAARRYEEQRRIEADAQKKLRQYRDHTVTVTIRNSSFDPAYIRYFRMSNRRIWWPDGGKAYFAPKDGQPRSATLACKKGETICYGAWAQINDEFYWGVGSLARQGCDDCCFACGGGDISYNLTADKKAQPKARRRNEIDPDVVNMAIQGIGLGVQLFNLKRSSRRGGGTTSCGGSCSGISGTN
jgi:hypothetical protein